LKFAILYVKRCASSGNGHRVGNYVNGPLHLRLLDRHGAIELARNYVPSLIVDGEPGEELTLKNLDMIDPGPGGMPPHKFGRAYTNYLAAISK
jgi:hypothetical protein